MTGDGLVQLERPPAASAGDDDEASLIEALSCGDEEAFSWLVRRHHGSLLRYAGVFCRDRAVAEEVVQETWLGVIRGIGAFQGRSSLTTWIFHILANRARTSGGRESRSVPFSALVARELEDDAPAVDPDRFICAGASRWPGGWAAPPQPWNAPEDRMLGAETRRVIDEAIAELPQVQRGVITLRDVLGMEADEACRVMSLTPGNQRILLHRARSRVRRALDAHLAPEPV